MRRHDLRHLEPYRTPPPPSWGTLDAEYYPPPREPSLAASLPAWVWGLTGYALGLLSFALLLAWGGRR